jgi:hypothetical protein
MGDQRDVFTSGQRKAEDSECVKELRRTWNASHIRAPLPRTACEYCVLHPPPSACFLLSSNTREYSRCAFGVEEQLRLGSVVLLRRAPRTAFCTRLSGFALDSDVCLVAPLCAVEELLPAVLGVPDVLDAKVDAPLDLAAPHDLVHDALTVKGVTLYCRRCLSVYRWSKFEGNKIKEKRPADGSRFKFMGACPLLCGTRLDVDNVPDVVIDQESRQFYFCRSLLRLNNNANP